MITIKVENAVEQSMGKAGNKFRRGCMSGLKEAGRIVKNRIRQLIKNPPKTGVKYPDLPNRSSAPGESPAYQTGKLSRSIQYIVPRWDRMEVGATASYGGYLELGTKKMRPRPYVSVAVSDTFNTVKMAISMHIDKEMK